MTPDAVPNCTCEVCPRCKGGGELNDKGDAPDPERSPTGLDLPVVGCHVCGETGRKLDENCPVHGTEAQTEE